MARVWPVVRERLFVRPMRLRTHLLVLTLGTLLPLLVFAVIASALFAERERQTFRDGATQRTLALLTAVDAQLGSSVTALESLATSLHLDIDDLRAFHAEATRVLPSQPDWLTVTLALPSGQQVVNLLQPFGAPLPMIIDRPSFDRVVRTGSPAVSSLVYGSLTKQHHFTVRVAVVRNGVVKYVLSAAVKPQAISRLLAAQRLPGDWVGVVLDGNDRIVARTVDSERTLGQLASESLRGALAQASEGWFHGSTIEGTPVYTPYNRSAWSGWSLALGIPTSAVEASARNTTWFMTAGLLLAAAVALLLALALGRRIAAPITSLADAAKAIGRGEPSSIARASRVEEVGHLGRALLDADAAVRAREESLQRADRAKDEFLAMLGHELRNPLGAIAGAVGVLELGGQGDEAAARARAVIGRQVQHLSRLVDDLLDVSRVTTGKVVLSLKPLDLAGVVADWIGGSRASGRLDNHQVGIEIAPVWIHADETRMEQVVQNLVGNALKYTPAGGRIHVRVAADGDEAVLEIADTGIGIPPELLVSIFDPFVQGDQDPDRAQGGLGLGLTLVKALTELHGGTVRAESPGPGKGSVFTVRLPRIAAPGPPPGRTAVSGAPRARRRRILVIEDNADAREMLRMLLALAGHEVHEAADGPAGLVVARTVAPDVALIDVGLPALDGYEVARRLRAAEEGKAMRLIAITGYGQADDRERARQAGFDAHLTKPVSPERLAAAMEGDAGAGSA
jgi:signal transduction histidine kinase/ActR/RegA family two-component response regulator